MKMNIVSAVYPVSGQLLVPTVPSEFGAALFLA